jgi:hypothetical protein
MKPTHKGLKKKPKTKHFENQNALGRKRAEFFGGR